MPVKLFDIGFDTAKYRVSSIKIVTDAPLNTEWQERILAPTPNDSAAYTSFSSAAGILPGQSASGFAVEFEWTTTGVPGTQPFQVYDPNSFAQLAQGMVAVTQRPGQQEVANVPTLSEWAMILLSLMLAGLAYREYNRQTV